MTSPQDGDPVLQPPPIASIPTLHVTKTRSPERIESPEASSTSLPLRPSTPSVPTLTSSLATALSRSDSPSRGRSLSQSRLGRSSASSPYGSLLEGYDDTRSLIVRAFCPTVGVYSSEDTDKLARDKGFKNGFVELIRPYGERVSGKVVVRDSVGASRAWDDFCIRFLDLGHLSQTEHQPLANPLGDLEDVLEQVVEQPVGELPENPASVLGNPATDISIYYRLFLTRLLSASPISPHEAFLHPAACVIAISSHTPAPIETLRQLYGQTAHGSHSLPPHANPEYLRYYILVHDEDQSDFSKSSALFDQMKRHFGLHCHLLRLRSMACTPTDDDAVEIPICELLSPSEDLAHLHETNNLIDLGSPTNLHIFDSDEQAIRSFVRELVAQSVIPHMENRIALWNEQVASRRRGISGRFMSLSKRWANLGSGSRTASSATSTPSAGGNYDPLQGTYKYDTSEALLRKMADYCFMLRDYKLAASTYELLRTDFSNDKAWKYLAGANEMFVVSSLLNPLTTAKSVRVNDFDAMLDTATYSYLTRCSDPTDALRAVVLSVELLKVRGQAAAEIAAKWAIRAFEMGVLGSIGRVLVTERVASCYAVQTGIGSQGWGKRKRKAAMWSVMAADEWMKLGRADLASNRLDEADVFFADVGKGEVEFKEMKEFVQQLQLAVRIKKGQARRRGMSEAERAEIDRSEREEAIANQTEQLERLDARAHRRTLSGAVNPLESAALTGPLSPIRLNGPDPLGGVKGPIRERGDEGFE